MQTLVDWLEIEGGAGNGNPSEFTGGEIPEEKLVEVAGEDMVFMPTDEDDELLLEQDFHKYSPEQRMVISQLNDVLKEIEVAPLFAQDEQVELSNFEQRILDLIDKE
jgi:hypothetical protein